MSWKIALIGLIILAVLAGVFLVSGNTNKEAIQITPSPVSSPQKPEKRASFAIFTNGTFRIFSDPRYHNKSEEVYIEGPDSPNIVLVKKEGITWGDFFKTLPMTLTKDCLTTGTGQSFCTGEAGTLGFYINRERVSNALDMEISDGDSLLVSFGSQNDEEIKSQLSQIPEPK